jgi:hypothetical protein
MNAASEFGRQHPGLVWSNPAASDSAHIRAALVRPRYRTLLALALEFGVARLRREWDELLVEPAPEVVRARATVERILAHIEEGFDLAAAGH